MGVRADFYYKDENNKLVWLGSIAWDGDPKSIPSPIAESETIVVYREAVDTYLDMRPDSTRPAQGWPWPWDNSSGTDYAYIFQNRAVYCCKYGKNLLPLIERLEMDEEPDSFGVRPTFPDMSERKNVAFDPFRGGISIFGSATQ